MKYFVSISVIVLITYVIWAFIPMQWNPAQWHEEARFLYVVATILWSGVTVSYIEAFGGTTNAS
jgi:hypothetical protein